MFQRFHEMVEEREGGFTLIELLVVVLIIAILAAIAIPFFLNQRERSFDSQAQSALKNAATAMESYATANNGTYPTADAAGVTALGGQGYRATANVTLAIDTTGNNYCLEVDHTKLGAAGSVDWHYAANDGAPTAGACP